MLSVEREINMSIYLFFSPLQCDDSKDNFIDDGGNGDDGDAKENYPYQNTLYKYCTKI